MPVNPRGIVDVYIDDIISLTVDIDDNIERIDRARLLPIVSIAQPKQENEPLPREEMEARNKLEAEAAAEDIKTILRWVWNFCLLLISLPTNKFTAWQKDMRDMIACGTSHAKELKKIYSPGSSDAICSPFFESPPRTT